MSDEHEQRDGSPSRDWTGLDERLHAYARMQVARDMPVPLTGREFWADVQAMMSDLDRRTHQATVRHGLASPVVQEMMQRQTRLRQSISQLAQNRLRAFMKHATEIDLGAPNTADDSLVFTHSMKPLEWSHHDVSERVLYDGLKNLISEFKEKIGWPVLIEARLDMEAVSKEMKNPDQTTLENWDSPPDSSHASISTESLEEEPWVDPDADIEEVAATEQDAFPEYEEGQWPDEQDLEMERSKSMVIDAQSDMIDDEAPPQLTSGSGVVSGMRRIRIVKTLPDHIIDEEGREVELSVGDIHLCEAAIARTLIDAEFAVAADV